MRNLWHSFLDHALGGIRGDSFYRKSEDAGKVTAPVAAPIVRQILASRGLPVTPEAALNTLADAAHLTQIDRSLITGLSEYVQAHLAVTAPDERGNKHAR